MVPEFSLATLRAALVVMGLTTLGLSVVVFFMMQIRYSSHLAREARRLTFANLIVPPWDGKALEKLWASSSRQDREIIEEVLAGQSQFLEGQEGQAFERAITTCAIFESWIHTLQSGSVSERVRVATALGYFHDGRGIRALAKSTQDSRPEVALTCVVSLGRLKSPSSIPALISFVRSAPISVSEITLAAALADCAREEPGMLVELLSSTEARPRLIGAWAISEVADYTVLAPLLPATRDGQPEVRAKVARALARINAPGSVEALIALARDPEWFVRVRAFDALGQLRAQAAEETALAALFDPVREVRYRAAFALRRIAGMKSEIIAKALASGSRLSFDSLISEWERNRFLDSVLESLSARDEALVNESEEVLKILISAGVTSALVNLLLIYPDHDVRLRFMRLLLQCPDEATRSQLLHLAEDPRCDPRMSEAILGAAPRSSSGIPSDAGAP